MTYLFLANGFEEIEALCPLDLLRRAGVQVTTVGVGGGEWITGAHGIEIRPDIPDTMYRDAKPEMVILPGGMPGAKNLDESATVKQALRAADRNGGYLAAICAAPMVLGALGIVKDRHATIYPGIEDKLIGATPLADEVVVDGNVITSRAPGTAIPFAIALAKLLTDEKTAAALTEDLVFRKA